MVGHFFLLHSKVPTVFNTTAALFTGAVESLFKIHVGNKLLGHQTEEILNGDYVKIKEKIITVDTKTLYSL